MIRALRGGRLVATAASPRGHDRSQTFSRSLQTSGTTPNQLQHLKKLTESDSVALSARLAAIVGEKNVSLAEAVRTQHGQDEGPDKGQLPDLVVQPGEVGEVSEVRSNFAISIASYFGCFAFLNLQYVGVTFPSYSFVLFLARYPRKRRKAGEKMPREKKV